MWGDDDPKYKRVLKVRNEKSKLQSSCSRCGKKHKGECLLGRGVCFRYWKSGNHILDCRVKNPNPQVQGVPKGQVAHNIKDSLSLATTSMIKSKKERLLFPPCAKCGRTHKGECMVGKKGCYKCGNMEHEQKNCPVATRLGREKKLKEVLIEEGLVMNGVMVPNDKVPMSPKAYDGTSSGKCKFYSFIVEIGKFLFVLI